MKWLCRLKPRSIEGYVGLCVAVSTTATQAVLVALLRDGLDEFLLLIPGAFVSWLLAIAIMAVVDSRRYGSLRDDWQEVRVFYSSRQGKGMGEYYPREPTLLLTASAFADKPDPVHSRPVEIWFNDAYVGEPAPGETEFENGLWGPLGPLSMPWQIPQTGVRYTRYRASLGAPR